MQINELIAYLNLLLCSEGMTDYCPNGLQVEGKNTVKRIITGVTASYDLIHAAVQQNADAIIVHHGIFWQGDSLAVTGMKKNRLAVLLQHQINLIAYHLPLDVHPVYGNNVQLAQLLEIQLIEEPALIKHRGLVMAGELAQSMNAERFADYLQQKLQHKPIHIAASQKQHIKKIAWCTGAGQKYIEAASEINADAFITGEISESTYHSAREQHIHFFAAGHHATERYGVAALGEHLANQFKLEHHFIDLYNPI